METKAELEAELALLRERLAGLEDDGPVDPGDRAAGGEPDQPAVEHGDDPVGALSEMLGGYGIDREDLAALWKQLSTELGDLPHNKPILLALGAFALGFLAGRSSK